MEFSIAQIATMLGGEVKGDASEKIIDAGENSGCQKRSGCISL
jgi:hypothetical protein